MRIVINISKNTAIMLIIFLSVLVVSMSGNYVAALVKWHPLSEVTLDNAGTINVTTASGKFNSSYLGGPIDVSSGGNVGIGTAPSSKKLTVSGNLSITGGTEYGIVFPDGTFMKTKC